MSVNYPAVTAQPNLRPPRPLVILALLLMLVSLACRAKTPIIGTELGGQLAPDFALTDQSGATVRLSALQGRPTVVAFLYTECPDVCPLTAQKLAKTLALLGADAARVGLIAVSTDPEHDDVSAARRFTATHELEGRWHFLVGSRGELAPVWAAYYIHASPPPSTDLEGRATHALQRGVHTDALYVLDRQGHLRFLLRSDFEPAQLAATLRGLANE